MNLERSFYYRYALKSKEIDISDMFKEPEILNEEETVPSVAA